MEHQDRMRYWALSQVQSAARAFAEPAVKAFDERLGHLVEDPSTSPVPAIGALFLMTEDHLQAVEKSLDKALSSFHRSRRRRWQATGRRRCAYKALRQETCHARRFAESQDQVHLGVRGPTPRDPEKLLFLGPHIHAGLLATKDPAARALAQTLADALEPLILELEEAIADARHAWAEEELDFDDLKKTRVAVDDEVAAVRGFLEASLELAGSKALSRKVLGKRRGRPVKKAKPQKAAETVAEKIEETVSEDQEPVRKIESVPPEAVNAPKKIDDGPVQEVRAAYTAEQKIKSGQSKACTELSELEEGSSKACTSEEKIEGDPCKPCTEPSENADVIYFQGDKDKQRRNRRRRTVSSLLGASAKWLPSAWVKNLASKGR